MTRRELLRRQRERQQYRDLADRITGVEFLLAESNRRVAPVQTLEGPAGAAARRAEEDRDRPVVRL